MKMFGFFRRKKNKSVVIDGKNIIINDICINEVFSECVARLEKAIKKQDFESVADVKNGLEKILKELDGSFVFDTNNCIYVNSGNINSNNINTSCIANNINSTAFFSSVTTNIGGGKNKAKIKQTSFFNKGNMVGGNITIQQSNINGDNIFKG